MREGKNITFNIGRQSGTVRGNVTLLLRPLTISGFKAYQDNTSRTFASSIIDRVNNIDDPAECEYYNALRTLLRVTFERM